MKGYTIEIVNKGQTLPADLLPIVDSARRAVSEIADEQDRKLKTGRLDKFKQGAFDNVIIRDRQQPVCFIAFEPAGEDITLRLGHILPGYEQESETILSLSVDVLTGIGFKAISSIFRWPGEEAFTRAAQTIGFTRVDRMNMVRKAGAKKVCTVTPADIEIVPWSAQYLEAAARIMFENAYFGDRVFHRPYRTQEGCRTYLEAILHHRYGQFLADFSFVACHNGRAVGQLLAARLPGYGIDVADLAVDHAFRGRGIGSALICNLIEANAAGSKEDILLTVTGLNRAAFSLYQRMGFDVTDDIGYYIYETDVSGQN